jgi:phosphoribosylformylglycinamidine synthase subunit PurS
MPRYRWHLGFLKHLTAYSCRAKALVFQHTSILVRPRIPSITRVYGGAAGYCPRVRCIYFTTLFIAIDGPKPDTFNIGGFRGLARPNARHPGLPFGDGTRKGIRMKARVTITLKPGVLDPQGRAIQNALGGLGFAGVAGVRQGKVIELDLADGTPESTIDDMAKKLLANTVIENYRIEIL